MVSPSPRVSRFLPKKKALLVRFSRQMKERGEEEKRRGEGKRRRKRRREE